MSDTKTVASGGVSFAGLLTIVFVTLKLTGHIDWSWPWVLSPLLITPALILSILVCVALGIAMVGAVCLALDAWGRFKRRGKR